MFITEKLSLLKQKLSTDSCSKLGAGEPDLYTHIALDRPNSKTKAALDMVCSDGSPPE